ncbi:MAG TPA: hypothetical protein VKS25_10115, partial [Solirubrobacteraceae bacterium]|nr:hypothetical protein [Solirubrobacteraceae bacterium]
RYCHDIARLTANALDRLRERSGGRVVPEATDKYGECWVADDLFVIRTTAGTSGWVEKSAWGRVSMYLRDPCVRIPGIVIG